MATLPQLPVELVERIVVSLTVEEVGNLRLVSRELRDKTSQDSYLINFINHDVTLNHEALKHFSDILSEDNLSRRLRKLSITIPVYDIYKSPHTPFGKDWDPPLLSKRSKSYCNSTIRGDHDMEERNEVQRRLARTILKRARHELDIENGTYPALLQECFAMVKQFCKDGRLSSLTLQCMADNGHGARLSLHDDDAKFNNISAHASYLFVTTMNALQASGLTTHNLDLFSSTRYMSLSCTELAPFMAQTPLPALRSLVYSVKTLAFAFSRLTEMEAVLSRGMCCDCNKRRVRRVTTEVICHKHLSPFEDEEDQQCQHESSLAAFLKLFSEVEELTLHQYEVEKANDKYNPIAFETVAHTVRLRSLKSLSLQGLNVTGKSLIAFLTTHSNITTLLLRSVNLKEGEWSAVLSHIKTQLPQLRLLHLEDLFEAKRGDQVSVPSTVQSNIAIPPALFGGVQHTLPAQLQQVDTYLNTVLAFRALGVPAEHVEISGLFQNNIIILTSPWIQKTDVFYSFVGHVTSKWKAEKKWYVGQTREFGPLPRDPFLDF